MIIDGQVPWAVHDFYSGSSLATAEITGVIALPRAKQSHLTAHEAQALLITDTPSVPDACAALAAMLHPHPALRAKDLRRATP